MPSTCLHSLLRGLRKNRKKFETESKPGKTGENRAGKNRFEIETENKKPKRCYGFDSGYWLKPNRKKWNRTDYFNK